MVNILNLNTAQPEELVTLPGVGPAMADRIIAARPYNTIDDLLTVSGIGPALFERLIPLVALEEPENLEDVIYLDEETETSQQELEFIPDEVDTLPPETTPEDAPPESEEEDEHHEDIIPKEKAIVPVNTKEDEKVPEPKKPKTVTWGRAFLAMGAFSLVSFFLAVLLTLGIIGTLNNGLRYASPTDLQAFSRQAESLDSQISILLEDIEGIRTRLDNLESVPAQISDLETATKQLNDDVTQTKDIIDGLDTQLEEIANSTSKFQIFLDGLADLLGSVMDLPQEETPQEAP